MKYSWTILEVQSGSYLCDDKQGGYFQSHELSKAALFRSRNDAHNFLYLVRPAGVWTLHGVYYHESELS